MNAHTTADVLIGLAKLIGDVSYYAGVAGPSLKLDLMSADERLVRIRELIEQWETAELGEVIRG